MVLFSGFFERSGFREFNGSQLCGDSSYFGSAGKGKLTCYSVSVISGIGSSHKILGYFSVPVKAVSTGKGGSFHGFYR